MQAVTVMIRPIRHGWAITLVNGRELARFNGLGAKRRGLRYLASHDLTTAPAPRLTRCRAGDAT